MNATHVPVLLHETTGFLAPQRGGLFVDCTLGLGGHAEHLLAAYPEIRLIGIDRDPEALAVAGRRLAPFDQRIRLVEGNFFDLAALLEAHGDWGRPAGILADLGVSSLQLDIARRGFSFRRDGPLDMRMGTDGLTAAEVINRYPEAELQRIFKELGEERHARSIARAVTKARGERPLKTTGDLVEVIHRVRPPGRRNRRGQLPKIDPATRVFQALRIEVNQELAGLGRTIDQAVNLLDQEGRLVVISYHSLEDRIVKNRVRELARGQIDQITGRPHAETQLIEVLTKKPLRPSADEVEANPRSRSARLRAARRI